MRGRKQLAPEQLLVSELGTLSLELTHLSQLTGDPKYYDAAQRVNDVIAEHQDKTKLPGMWPVVVDAGTPSFAEDNNFHFGGMSDSLYEYIPKQYLLLGGLLQQPRNMYEKFIAVAKKHHFARILNPENKKLLVSGEVRVFSGQPTLNPQGQHLTCFVGGMVAIAGKIFESPEEVEIGAQLADGCVWAYDSQVTGIAPEIFTVATCSSDEDCQWSETKWHNAIAAPSTGQETEEVYTSRVKGIIAENRLAPGFTRLSDKKYILRPEAIESVFILYRVTGDRAWQDKAWKMFEAVEKYTRTDIASSAINDVTLEKPKKTDSMESFWLAETLKYFYLCFAETNVVSLDEFVL
jgi:mannosyl-oligosaccharide alpha-1,2-mannosidase